jgi:hypothetical protein
MNSNRDDGMTVFIYVDVSLLPDGNILSAVDPEVEQVGHWLQPDFLPKHISLSPQSHPPEETVHRIVTHPIDLMKSVELRDI